MRVLPILRQDPEATVWWGSRVEWASALARAVRRGRIAERWQHDARRRLAELASRCIEVDPSEDLRDRAVRLLNSHVLSAADALQLAAALDWCEERTSGAGFVCLDERLRLAALREGFDVLPFPEEVHERVRSLPPQVRGSSAPPHPGAAPRQPPQPPHPRHPSR